MTKFNRKITFDQKIRIKLSEFGIKQWAYYLNTPVENIDLSNTNGYIEIKLSTYLSVFGGHSIVDFIEENCFYIEETKVERRKRIIRDLNENN